MKGEEADGRGRKQVRKQKQFAPKTLRQPVK
jgi:hypothetical protein